MKNFRLYSLLVTLCLFCRVNPVFSQKKVNLLGVPQNSSHAVPNRIWVDVSTGLALIAQPTYFGILYGGNLHYLDHSFRHYQLRYNYIQSDALFGSGKTGEISDIGYLWGRLLVRHYFMAEAAVGVAAVVGQKKQDQTFPGHEGLKQFVTIGLPAELDIKFMCRRYFGLGLSLKGNLNPQASYVSLGLELTFNGPN